MPNQLIAEHREANVYVSYGIYGGLVLSAAHIFISYHVTQLAMILVQL